MKQTAGDRDSKGGVSTGMPLKFVRSEETTMTNTLWKCEQYRAGQITNRVMFDTREEAESFVAQMRKVEPDLFWRMEAVEAKMVWN